METGTGTGTKHVLHVQAVQGEAQTIPAQHTPRTASAAGVLAFGYVCCVCAYACVCVPCELKIHFASLAFVPSSASRWNLLHDMAKDDYPYSASELVMHIDTNGHINPKP